MKILNSRLFKYVLIISALFILLTLTGCLPRDGSNSAADPAGLLTGIWHGWIAPVSLVFSFFRDDISIYEPNNVGFLYDLGYYMAILGGFFGLSLSRKRNK